jgi:hypothetical protein
MTVHPGVSPAAGRVRRTADPERRAAAMWPRLDRRALARCGGDPERIARLVERRTALSHEVILLILREPGELERELWFG